MCLVPFLLLGFVGFASSKPPARRWDDFAEKHSWVRIPTGWEFYALAPRNDTFDMHIGLKQPRMAEFIENLMEISDPTHGRYGDHLTKEEADTFLTPHFESFGLVEEWLEAHDVDTQLINRTDSGNWLTVRVSVSQAERMLNTSYNMYNHTSSDNAIVRAMGYSIPRILHDHIEVVAPTTYFGTLYSMNSAYLSQPKTIPIEEEIASTGFIGAAVPVGCGSAVTPSCLRALYNTTNYVPTAINRNSLGVTGYLNQYASRSDLQTFLTRFRSDATGTTFSTVQVNGGGDDQNKPGGEANLDIQYTVGISFPTLNVYYSTGGSPPFIPDSATPSNRNEPYLDWLNYILAQSSIPQVITTSYGEDEQTVPQDYATSVCNMFATLGARGTTVFFSSGDYGVGAGSCLMNDGGNSIRFQPVFPASCPFVTAVGGTTNVNPEVAASLSGGGFSRYFSTPSYQDTAVSNYVQGIGQTFSGLFNPAGRAYPDLAAQGTSYQVVFGGKIVSVNGTSASSPTVAAIFSLLNDFRLSKGFSSLGFINPLIYSIASTGFNDIVSGSNPGCGTNGFTAGRGWDPVTGLGTPDFLKLQTLLGN